MKYLTTATLTGESGAILSDCERYRLLLWREWDKSLPVLVFLMLNPSTADHRENDKTITRCVGRAVTSGFGRIDVVNLFPLRSTNPDGLLTHPAPLGDDSDLNMRTIVDALGRCSMAICAWGAHKAAPIQAAEVLRAITAAGSAHLLYQLGLNKDGSPKHPLYIAAATKPMPYRP